MSFKTIIPTFFATCFIIMSCTYNPTEKQPISVMTYNLKYDDTTDHVHGWEQRKNQVAHLIAFYEPIFLGTQEALLHQLEYLETKLDHYKWIGEGRDGAKEGEFSALFYDSTRVRLVEGSANTIWLSETPSKPSKGWDAAFPRILTYGAFRDRISGQEFFVFNTHFDHLGDTARAESAKLILKKIKAVAGSKPVILTGDFNFTPGSDPYSILTSSQAGLLDAFHHSKLPHVGPLFTYEGFSVGNTDNRRRIDYIFVDSSILVQKHAAISNFRGTSYPSDHLPVYSEMSFKE